MSNVYRCVRQPGYMLEFSNLAGDLYQCTQCRKFKKMRSVKIVNDAIVPWKMHQEDGHHVDCKATPEAGTKSNWPLSKLKNNVFFETLLQIGLDLDPDCSSIRGPTQVRQNVSKTWIYVPHKVGYIREYKQLISAWCVRFITILQ